MRAAAGGPFGGDHLGNHAAPAVLCSGAASHGFERRITGAGLGDQRGVGVFARIGREQPVLVREDDQAVRVDEIGNECAERVVIAELDFVRNDRVVFVDDGYDAQFEQGR